MMVGAPATIPPHWLHVLGAPDGCASLKRRAWKVLREGQPIEQHLANTDWMRSWSIAQTVGEPASGAVKFRLRSNRTQQDCETVVLFPKQGRRATACISSQIGCGVGCLFCATGTMGFQRNLRPEEMLEQVYLARCLAQREGRHLRNVVLMGMGEPLHNLEAVCDSIAFMVSDRGFGLRERFVTVSTSGIPSAMLALVRRFPAIRMALSLHTANGSDRRLLMPKAPNDLEVLRETVRAINRIQAIREEHKDAPEFCAVPVWIEYVLLDGWNDSLLDAERLLSFCKGLCVEVNLIPLNGTAVGDGKALAPSPRERQQEFAAALRRGGITTTIRNSFGAGENAACGQLVTY
ncbi:putative dual-specificity RNA methyltransferase RlmN [Pirellula sp. SH-Sr6A]|nr:putative dual-specificity RNA methyltransferase RlmN [Pirellula sp. SH-Sr6A]